MLSYATGWCTYCYGKDFWTRVCQIRKQLDDELGDTHDSPGEESDKSSGTANSTKGSKISKVFNDIETGHIPLTSIVAQLRQTELICMIEHQIAWVELVGIALKDQGLWIYALMAALEKPLHPDVTR